MYSKLILVFALMISLISLSMARVARKSSTRSLSMVKRLPTLRSLKSTERIDKEKKMAKGLMDFINSAPEPFHVVRECINRLDKLGFEPLCEKEIWRKGSTLKKGGKYYFTRNGSSIIAFTIGDKYESGNGFKIIGAHTDSPNLKLKPRTSRPASNGLLQLAVETYGGGLWHTWFDRDLSLAGRVVIRNGDSEYSSHLVKIDRPILRVPNLAIHLTTAEERAAFKVNKEDHLIPILCQEVGKALGGSGGPDEGDKEGEEDDQWQRAQQPELMRLLADELGCSVKQIADFELSLYDCQTGSFNGLNEEFIASSRLDNLASCYVAVEALANHVATGSLLNDSEVSLIALFDHEEVGSTSSPGAGSSLMRDALCRISDCLNEGREANSGELFKASIGQSLVLSVDMAHAIHPNYASKHEKGHSPLLNSGVVIKTNSNQRYATNGVTGFIVRELGRRSGVPVQEFAVRNDCPCGSTIGPAISAATGVRAIDLGMPQWSMHSIRECMGTSDVSMCLDLFSFFFKEFKAVDSTLDVDRH